MIQKAKNLGRFSRSCFKFRSAHFHVSALTITVTVVRMRVHEHRMYQFRVEPPVTCVRFRYVSDLTGMMTYVDYTCASSR